MSSRGPEHRRSPLNILLEVILIGLGVFLGLLANNWHEEREHRALAESTLRNFAREMGTNQQAVQTQREYHERLLRQFDQFLAGDEPPTQERLERSVPHFTGVHPITFEHTAWDLALATQALQYLTPELAFDVSTVYTKQTAFQKLQDSFLGAAFTPSSLSTENPKGLVTAMRIYLGDVNVQEPQILQRYREVIPEIDRALTRHSTR